MRQVAIQGRQYQATALRAKLTALAIRSALGELKSEEEEEIDRIYAEHQQNEAERDCPRWWSGG